MNDAPSPSQRSVGAVVHAVRILRHLAGQGTPSGVAAIARETRVNASTCFNILKTLAQERFVTFDPETKTYALGLGVIEIATGLIGANHADLIRPELERLALNYRALICLWHVTDTERIVVADRAFADTVVRIDMRIGTRLPAFVGAVGRCVAAARGLSESELRRRFAGLRWQSPPDFETYLAEVAAAARDGYAFDRGQLFTGVDAVASVAVDREGRPRLGLSGIAIVGQVDEDELHRLAHELRGATRMIGAALFSA